MPSQNDSHQEASPQRSAAPGLLLGAAVVVLAFALILLSDTGSLPVVRGALAPDFDLPLILEKSPPGGGGERGSLSLADLRGRVVLVNFWATWCKPCTSEMPAMERLYASLADQGFELLAVSIDDETAEARDFASRFGLSFPILHDRDQAVYKQYQTMGVPESLLIDVDGRVVERYVGSREWDAPVYRARVLELIGEGSDTGLRSPAAAPDAAAEATPAS